MAAVSGTAPTCGVSHAPLVEGDRERARDIGVEEHERGLVAPAPFLHGAQQQRPDPAAPIPRVDHEGVDRDPDPTHVTDELPRGVAVGPLQRAVMKPTAWPPASATSQSSSSERGSRKSCSNHSASPSLAGF